MSILDDNEFIAGLHQHMTATDDDASSMHNPTDQMNNHHEEVTTMERRNIFHPLPSQPTAESLQSTFPETPVTAIQPEAGQKASPPPVPLQQPTQQDEQPTQSPTTDPAQFVRTLSADNMTPGQTINPAIAKRNEHMKEAARSRIQAQIRAKYPDHSKEFHERKVNKQLALMYPESGHAANGNGSVGVGVTTPATSTATPLPQHPVEGQHPVEPSHPGLTGHGGNLANQSHFTPIQLSNSTDQAAPREFSQTQDVSLASRSALPAQTNRDDLNGNGGDATPEERIPSQTCPRSPLTIDKLKKRGILVGYYKLSDVANDDDKHAVFAKIDKGGDLFTTASRETRSGKPVPSRQYLASKVQCHPDKICFEPYLDGLNKHQLKQFVHNRLSADWTHEDDNARKMSERHFADMARNDPVLIAMGADELTGAPGSSSAIKRSYTAFAEDNDDDDDDDDIDDDDGVSPPSEANEANSRESDDEYGIVTSNSNKKRKSTGRKFISAGTAKAKAKDLDSDDIGEGVLVGVWAGSPAEPREDKHAVYAYLDARNSLWCRVFHNTKDGRRIDMEIPFPRGTVKWRDIILDAQLQHMNRADAKEYVRQTRRLVQNGESAAHGNAGAETPIKQENCSPFKSKTSAVLLGYWSKSLEKEAADKNAVYGYVDTSGRFNLQVRKHTRDGRELTEVNPDFPGNGRVQRDHLVLERHLAHLSHAEIQQFTRHAISQGLPDLAAGDALREAEVRLVEEIVRNRGSEVAGEDAVPEVRVKRKYTRRSGVRAEAAGATAADAPQRPSAPLSGPMLHAAASAVEAPALATNAGPSQGFVPPRPLPVPRLLDMGPPHALNANVRINAAGNAVINGVEWVKLPRAEAPTIDESGTTITNNGVQYTQKANGTFKGKFVGSKKEIVSVGGNDYIEYKVLVPME